MNAIRIAITGTHSTGKSTFCNSAAESLTKRGFKVGRVSDLATAARDHGFPILREHTHDSTLWIITQGIANELVAALSNDVVIVDRGVPDALGYWLAALEHRGETAKSDELTRISSIVRAHTSSYHLLFNTVLNRELPLGENQERDKDMHFRESAEKHIVSTLQEIGASPIPLNNGGIESAVDLVVALVEHNRNQSNPSV
ncbi:MAG: ATP-binding protein [Candidatus Obscuribacterales bacterium]|nr:ATP-binding protein [Candidatus Obscuribacterales bacterium]